MKIDQFMLEYFTFINMFLLHTPKLSDLFAAYWVLCQNNTFNPQINFINTCLDKADNIFLHSRDCPESRPGIQYKLRDEHNPKG